MRAFPVLRISVFSCIVIQLASTVYAQSVTLAWDPQTGPDFAGYNIYRSEQSGRFPTTPVNAVPLKNASYTDPSIQYNRTYYYAVKAVGVKGVLSRFSNEIRVTTGPARNQNTYSLVRDAKSQGSLHAKETITAHLPEIRAQFRPTGPSGLAVVTYRENGTLVYEAVFQTRPLLTNGRAMATIQGPVDAGIAISNPHNEPVALDFYFTDAAGTLLHTGSTRIAAAGTLSTFLRETPFAPPADVRARVRTWTFSASLPIAITAVRTLANERGSFLMAPLPIAQLNPPEAHPLTVPYYAEGEGWRSELQLVNPTDSEISGVARFLPNGGSAPTDFIYQIPPRSAVSVTRPETGGKKRTGWIRVLPNKGTPAPASTVILSSHAAGLTMSQATIQATSDAYSSTVYVEISGRQESPGSTDTVLVIGNSADEPVHLNLEPLDMQGKPTGRWETVTVDGNTSRILSISQLPGIMEIAKLFKGFFRVHGGAASIVGLKRTYTEGGNHQITVMPASSDASLLSAEPLFAFSVSGGGYTTEFVAVTPTR
jgi:hypothetical protein